VRIAGGSRGANEIGAKLFLISTTGSSRSVSRVARRAIDVLTMLKGKGKMESEMVRRTSERNGSS